MLTQPRKAKAAFVWVPPGGPGGAALGLQEDGEGQGQLPGGGDLSGARAQWAEGWGEGRIPLGEKEKLMLGK